MRSGLGTRQLSLFVRPASSVRCRPKWIAELSQDCIPQPTGVRGQIYAALGRWAEAIADLDTAIAGGVSEASTFASRGHAHEASGNREAAIADYCMALTRHNNVDSENAAHAAARERLAAFGIHIEPDAKQ
jgi:hypothetical protein